VGETAGCGIDVVEIARVERLLSRYPDSFAERWFLASEIAECLAGDSPGERFASHLAAKESVVKALGMDGRGQVPWRHIEVSGLAEGCMDVCLTGALATVARQRGIGRISVSVSTTGGLAMAVAIASCGSAAPANS